MKVETIEFNGVKYRRYPESGRSSTANYYNAGGTHIRNGGKTLHQEIWIYNNGPIPDGYCIHHINGNTLNNNLSNLECIPWIEHNRLHKTQEWKDLKEDIATCTYCNKEFTYKNYTKPIYCSDKCGRRARSKLPEHEEEYVIIVAIIL